MPKKKESKRIKNAPRKSPKTKTKKIKEVSEKSFGRVKKVRGNLFYSYRLGKLVSEKSNKTFALYRKRKRQMGQIAATIKDAKKNRMEGKAASAIQTLTEKRKIPKTQAAKEYLEFQKALLLHYKDDTKYPKPELDSPDVSGGRDSDEERATVDKNKMGDWE